MSLQYKTTPARLTTYTKQELANLLNFSDSRNLRKDLIRKKGEAFLKEIGWERNNQRITVRGVQKIWEVYGRPEET